MDKMEVSFNSECIRISRIANLLQAELELLINRTPTGEQRNGLTELNMAAYRLYTNLALPAKYLSDDPSTAIKQSRKQLLAQICGGDAE